MFGASKSWVTNTGTCYVTEFPEPTRFAVSARIGLDVVTESAIGHGGIASARASIETRFTGIRNTGTITEPIAFARPVIITSDATISRARYIARSTMPSSLAFWTFCFRFTWYTVFWTFNTFIAEISIFTFLTLSTVHASITVVRTFCTCWSKVTTEAPCTLCSIVTP